MRVVPVLLFALCLHCAQSATILNWFWNKPSEETTVLVADGVPLVSIPYETMTDDEKFLQEAAKFTDIKISSPLETCQHKVVMKIRTSCSDMAEEELAKMSVNLLNCQSAVEGRKMFPCTEEMSLKQCTTDMDADMWNAYHLMSNRARAVCYASRSTQFRALTELTVNKLMQTAHSQIQALGSLKESQERLEDQTREALSSLASGNEALLQQQEHLSSAQTTAYNLVTSNLRELNNEKALIRSGHTQLAKMAEDIKAKLEKASADLLNQAQERYDNHNEVLRDLMNIQEQAKLIWDKIESSTDRIVAQNAEAAAQYEQTLEKLEKINKTIHFIWNVTESMRNEVDLKLGWITEYIGDTGEQFNKVYRTMLHVVYLIGAMIVASFLQAPFVTRATIIGLVPINLMTFLKHGMDSCLDFTSITTLIFFITGMHFLMSTVQYFFGPKSKTVDDEDTPREQTFAYRNGTTTARAHQRSSASDLAPTSYKFRIPAHAITTIRQLIRTVAVKLIDWKDKTVVLVQSAASWFQQNSTPVEELSCSYLPSKKSREDVVTDFAEDFPSISDDGVDFEKSLSRAAFNRREAYDDTDNIVDARDLRRRLTSRDSPASSYNFRSSPSRSVTPNNMAALRILCGALTKSGSKCRSRAVQGGYLCTRHRSGSSIIGD